MVKLSSNPTCVLSDADVITNEQAERIAKVLTKHLPGADSVTEAGKILGIDANGDVSLVEDKTGSTYTAGDGIDIDAQNEVSVNVGTGLSINSVSTVDMTLKATKLSSKYQYIGTLTAQAVAAIKDNAALDVTVLGDYVYVVSFGMPSFDDARIVIAPPVPGVPGYPNLASNSAIISSTNIKSSFAFIEGSTYKMSANTQVTVNFANAIIGSDISWEAVEADPTNYMLVIAQYASSGLQAPAYSTASGSDPEQKDVATIEYTVAGDNSLQVSNPLPTSAIEDAGKVLTVNAQGASEWATPSGGGDGGITWSRNTQPSGTGGSSISAALSGLSVTDSACVVYVSFKMETTGTFGVNIPTLNVKIREGVYPTKWFYGTLQAEPSTSDYSTASSYRAYATMILPYGSPRLDSLSIEDPNYTFVFDDSYTYDVSVGVAK